MSFDAIITDAFTYILNMSITGSYIILAVLLARILLKKAPKKISYLLWIAPFVRLVCPFTPRSPLSFFNLGIFNKDVYTNNIHEYVPLSYDWDNTPDFATGITQGQSVIPNTFEAFSTSPENSVNKLQVYLFILACVWILGMVALLIYAGITFIKTKRRLRTAVKLDGNVFESENISSPFVIGIFRPKIYLPYGLGENEREYIILHEKTHIKNLDHFSKIFAFFVLTVHWYNPLCYLAFTLMSRDMEMTCDEAVLKKNEGIRKAYSSSLLSFATNKKLPSPSPLCFGESGAKQRIKNALSWKKPKTIVIAFGLVILLVCTVAFISNPQKLNITSKVDPALDEAISQMIIDEVNPTYFCAAEGHKIFGTAQNGDELTVYGYMSFNAYNFVNGCLTDYGNGGHNPFVAIFVSKNNNYELKEVKYPQDGMGYGDSIREMFPADFERKALNPYDYLDELKKQEFSQAEAALKEAGIICKVADYNDFDRVYIPDEADKNMADYQKYISGGYTYPLGVAMYETDGKFIVYEKRADAEKGRYYYAEYENTSTEASAHAFDKEGNYLGQEVIAVKNFFDYEAPNGNTELYYTFDESMLTTKAIILEEGEALPDNGPPPEPTTRLINSETSEVF